MKTNYDSLKEHNLYLAEQLIEADSLVKTHPQKAAIAYGKAMQTFMAIICANNDIAFDRTKDLTPINMIGVAYSYGVISKYEKSVLDDIRYIAYTAKNPKAQENPIDTKTLVEKIINFYGMVMRYYHLENEEYSYDILPIGSANVISILKNFEMDTAYDKVFLASDSEGGFSKIAEYVLHQSELGDEVFALLENEDLKTLYKSCKKVIRPEIVPYEKGNNVICVKTKVPSGYVSLSFDDFMELYTEQRLKFCINLADVIYDLHEKGGNVSLGGFEIDDIWVSYKGLKCAITGLESKIGKSEITQDGIREDIKSFAAVCISLLPEYEKIPVAGLLIKHALMGSEKTTMEKIVQTLKKETKGLELISHQLKDLMDNPKEYYEEIKDGIIPERKEAPKEELDVDFDEMYSKVFGE